MTFPEHDIALKELLENKVTINTSATQCRTLKVYAAGERPNKGLDDEFVEIIYNGSNKALTVDRSLWSGNLAIYIQVKTQTNNTVKKNRIRETLNLLSELIHLQVNGGFLFSLSLRPVTPTRVDNTTGYSTTTINVAWRSSY